jgi:hypothetical protein
MIHADNQNPEGEVDFRSWAVVSVQHVEEGNRHCRRFGSHDRLVGPRDDLDPAGS